MNGVHQIKGHINNEWLAATVWVPNGAGSFEKTEVVYRSTSLDTFSKTMQSRSRDPDPMIRGYGKNPSIFYEC